MDILGQLLENLATFHYNIWSHWLGGKKCFAVLVPAPIGRLLRSRNFRKTERNRFQNSDGFVECVSLREMNKNSWAVELV